MIDLLDEATKNVNNVESAFDSVKNEPNVEEFADSVQREAFVTINRGPKALRDHLTQGVLENAFAAANRIPCDIVTYLTTHSEKKWFTGYAVRRQIFSNAVLDGASILYGALNLGSDGTKGKEAIFGYYSIRIEKAIIESAKWATCCKRDMLSNDYWTKDPHTILWNRLTADLAPFSHADKLAAVKHASDPRLSNREEWPSILIDPKKRDTSWSGKGGEKHLAEEFIEVAFVGVVPMQKIKVVFDTHLNKMIHDLSAALEVSSEQQALAKQYYELVELMRELKVEYE